MFGFLGNAAANWAEERILGSPSQKTDSISTVTRDLTNSLAIPQGQPVDIVSSTQPTTPPPGAPPGNFQPTRGWRWDSKQGKWVKSRRRRRRLLTAQDKADIAFLHGQLGGGALGRAAISAVLSRRVG